MAKPPVICKDDLANSQIQQGYFDRCTFVVTKDSALTNSISFCDFSMNIDNFFTQTLRLKPGNAFLLDDAQLGNEFGEISFFLVKVTYPQLFTSYSSKYIDLIYDNITYPIGEINIWTGEPGISAGSGITAYPNSSETESPFFISGGIVLYNPHQYYVDVKIILGSKGVAQNLGQDAPIGLLTSQDGDFIFIEGSNGDYLVE